MLNTAASLRKSLVEREFFNPEDPRHLASLDVFLKTGNWGDIQFYPELPFIEVPVTVLTKFAMHARNVQPETVAEQTKRMSSKTLTPLKFESKEDRAARLARSNDLLKAAITEIKAQDRKK